MKARIPRRFGLDSIQDVQVLCLTELSARERLNDMDLHNFSPMGHHVSLRIRAAFLDSIAVRISGETAIASIERNVSEMYIWPPWTSNGVKTRRTMTPGQPRLIV